MAVAFGEINHKVFSLFKSYQEILEAIEADQVIELLKNMGVTDWEEKENEILFPTICHNQLSDQSSLKLYYYKDSKRFHCFTECQTNFSLIDLINAVRSNNKLPKFNDHNMKTFLMQFCPAEFFETLSRQEAIYRSASDRFRTKIGLKELPTYSENVLSAFSDYKAVEWISDGISAKTMEEFGIKFYIGAFAIIIPHRGLKGNLVGIRVRNLNYSKELGIPKYAPLYFERQLWAHPLSLNLFGLWEHRKAIQEQRRIILFESEKGVMQHHTMYGENSNAVAVCGSNFYQAQMKLIIKGFNVQEIIFGFDREYDTPYSREADAYFARLWDMGKKYINYAKISLIYDNGYLTKLKGSPTDYGKEVFEKLYKTRIQIK